MNPNSDDKLTRTWVRFKPGELLLAQGITAVMVTAVFTHFVMGWLLAVMTAPLALILLSNAVIRARDSSAPAGRQWAGIGLLLVGCVAILLVAFNACSLSYKLALHAQRPTSPVPNLRAWVLNLGSWPIPALLLGTGLSLWTNWSPRRRLGWCVIILAVPLAALLLHRFLAVLGGPLTA